MYFFPYMVEVLVAVGNTSGKYDGLALSICHSVVCVDVQCFL